MGSVTRLQTKPERLKATKAAEIRQMLLPLGDDPEVPKDALRAVLYALDRQAEPTRPKEAFVMMYPWQNAAVVEWLMNNSKRPLKAAQLWALLFCNVDRDGLIMLSREELAEKVGIEPRTVSEIMGELEKFNAIFKRRTRVAGMRGPGRVEYYMNPHVAEVMHRMPEEEKRQIPLPGFEPRVIEGGREGGRE
jgi:hypothetical protein